MWHRIMPERKFDPLNGIVSLKTFIKQIDFLASRFPVIPLNEAINLQSSGCLKVKDYIALTFDDGYVDGYEIILPILRKKGLPATFFLVTDYINSSRPLWDWETATLLNNNINLQKVQVGNLVIHQKNKEPRYSFIYRIIEEIKPINHDERQKLMNIIKVQSGKILSNDEYSRCLNWDEVKKMAPDMEIGAHSMSHRSLARIAFNEAVDEIKKSKELIEKNIKRECLHFAFPFGGAKDYSQGLIECVRSAGFQTCLLSVHGYNHLDQDNLSFKRIRVCESTDLRYLLGY
jgi:peptidoglycan/xylan/chitin deacetylase (PgdA/CDA1 family)